MKELQMPELWTGEFAKLGDITKRPLFHYDEIGLFFPVFAKLLDGSLTRIAIDIVDY